MLRTHPSRLITIVITGLLLSAGLQAPAGAVEPAVSRTLALSVSSTSGIVKSSVKFTGKVSRSPKGSVISIQRKSGASWINVSSTRTTNTAGNYALNAPLPASVGTYAYRALAPAKGNLRGALSRSLGIKALNKVTVTLSANPLTVPAGSNVTLTGKVAPFKATVLVAVQKLFNGSWTNVTTATTMSNGTFSKTLNVGPTTQIRVVSPQVDYNAAATSPTVTITTTPVIATQTLPTATRTVAYSAKLITIDGSVGTWTASPLPAGLSINANTGVISGTPTMVQNTATEVSFKKTSTGEVAPTKTITVTVNEAPRPLITTNTLPSGNRTRPYSTTLKAQGDPAGTWSASPLPDGLSLNTSTGVISGTPTTIETKAVNLGFTATSTGQTAIPISINLHIDEAPAPVITTSALPNGKRFSAYSFTLAATVTGTDGGTWAASPLPAGLSITAGTGVISGTPTTVGTTNVVISFTQTSTGVTSSRTLPLVILQADPPVISTTALPNGKRLSPYSSTLTAQGNPTGKWTASGLPSGLSIDTDTGEIFGTPTVVFDGNVTVGFTQTSTGVAASKVLALKVVQADPPSITTSTLPTATAGTAYSTTLQNQGSTAGVWTASPLPAGLSLNQNTGVISGTPTASGSTSVVIGFTQTSTSVAAATKTIALKVLPGIANGSLVAGTVGTAYSVDLQAVDNNQTGTWTAAPLPGGLSLDAGTGTISGNPTTAGTTDVVVAFKKSSSGLTSASRTLSIVIKPVITTATLPAGSAEIAYTTTLVASGGSGGTWSAAPLPDGLTLNTGTGVISGTPTAAGTTNVVITYTRGGVAATGKSLALAIKPVITTVSLPDGTDGAAYTTTLAAVGGPGTWSASPLPDGLSISTSTGVISGTPTDAGTTNVVIGYTSAGVAATTKTLALKVRPVITTTSLPDGVVGAAYPATTLTGSGTGTWTAAPLPAGLTLNANTGAISGAPTTAGTTNVVIGFTRNGAAAATRTLVIDVKPVITTASLPGVDVGAAYSATLTAASGGTGTWTAAPLPDGLVLNATTGKVTGTPTAVGSTSVVIGFTSGGVAADSKTLTLAVRPVIGTTTLPGGAVGTAYSTTLTGTGTGTWTATPLPAGLSIDSATGVISGNPTTAGSTNVVIGYTVSGVAATTKTLALAIKPSITTSSLADGTVGSVYSVTLAAAGGSGTWTASPLPAGLSVDGATGVISGTPTNAITTNVVVGFTSGGQAAATRTLSLAVHPVISTASLPDGTRVSPYSFTLTATGTGTWTATPLPAGLVLDASTGAITGTPTTVGTTNVVIGFTRNGVAAAPKTLTLVINQAAKPVITTSTLPGGTRKSAYTVTLAAQGNPAGTWTASPLPDGLALDADSGIISGTPDTVQSVDVVIGFTQTSTGLAAVTKTLTLQIVQAAPPVISTSTLPSTTVGAGSYSTTLTATGNPAGTWTASPLPAGLSLNATTGAITGSPTASGTTAVVIGFTQTSTGVAATPKTINLLVNASVTTSSLPDGTRTLAYPSTTVHAVGDPAGTWAADNLPEGLSISNAGVITGTPTTVGTTNNVILKFTQTANGSAPQVTRTVSLTIAEVPAPVITTTSLTAANVNQAYTSNTPAVTTTGASTGVWSATGMPNGVTIDSGTGVISGTPTASGTSTVALKFTQTSSGLSDTANLSLVVNAAITTAALPNGTRTLAYTNTQVAAFGTPAGTWTATNLPVGLAISNAGVISGTPSAVGTTTVTLKFTQTANGGAPQVSKDLSVQIVEVAGPQISTNALDAATVNSTYTSNTPAVTTTGPAAGLWSATGLPAGLAIAGATGIISGTPTASGTSSVTLKFTQNSSGLSDTATINLVVNAVITTSSLPDGTRTLAYTNTQVAAFGTPAGTWSATNLPAGLSISGAGIISGTPSALGTSTVTLKFTQSANGGTPQVSRDLSLTVNEVAAPNITTNALTAATVNSAYTSNTPAVTTTGPAAGSWSATGLPGTLSISSSTGVITGTPSASGTIAVALKFTQASSGLSDTANLNLVVNAVITTSSLPDGTRTFAYTSTQVTASGTPAGTWTATNLPAGLTISTGGVLSGTPTVVGTKTVTLKFTQTANGGAPQVTKNIDVDIIEAPAPSITTNALNAATVNVGYTSNTPAVTTTGPAAGTWSATGLPGTLSISSSTGVIAGTPTASGTIAVALKFTQTSTGLSDTANLNLVVNAVITTSSLPDGTRTLAYPSTTVHAAGDPAGTWTATNLPAGLAISSGGVITGTPNAVGPNTVTLKFTQTANGGAPQVTKDVSLTVNEVAGPQITTNSLTAATVSSAYTSNTPAVTTTGPAVGTWSATGLPGGLSIAGGTGTISGTPAASGTFAVVLTFTQNSSALSDTANLNLVVNAVITTASLPNGTRQTPYSSTTVHAFGDPAGTWTATNLPTGLSISAGGVITGTPSLVQTKTVTLKFTQTANGGLPQITKDVGLTINEADAPTISTTALSDGKQLAAYSDDLDATGNPAGSWTQTGLPAGLTLDGTTGELAGAPTSLSDVGDNDVAFTFTQTSTGLPVTKHLNLHINQADPPTITTNSVVDGQQGVAYSDFVQVAGNPTGTWSASGLPSGLSINTTTGEISGTPTMQGDIQFDVTFTQTNTGRSVTKNIGISLAGP